MLGHLGTWKLILSDRTDNKITRTGVNCQICSKFGNVVLLALELLALEGLTLFLT